MDPLPELPYGNPFKHVRVDFKVAGASRVTWDLERHFLAPTPYTYQLQWSWSGNPDADDWADAASSAQDVFTLVDDEPRKLGKLNIVHYRVKLTDGDGDNYYSEPANSEGNLDQREWALARELIFREKLINARLSGCDGYLLKAKRHGEACPDCLDPFTGEVTNSKCETCHGNRFISGYYAPLQMYMRLVNPGDVRESNRGQRATIGDNFITGRFVASPQIYSYDVWVDKDSDERYYIHKVQTVASIKSVPLVYQAEMRLASVDDAVYDIQVP